MSISLSVQILPLEDPNQSPNSRPPQLEVATSSAAVPLRRTEQGLGWRSSPGIWPRTELKKKRKNTKNAGFDGDFMEFHRIFIVILEFRNYWVLSGFDEDFMGLRQISWH